MSARQKRNRMLDRMMALDALRLLASTGNDSATSADISRTTREMGHYVAKKFIRRLLTQNADGVTPLGGVHLFLRNRKFRYCYPQESPCA